MFVEIIFIGVALSILFGAIQLMLAPLNDSKPKENNDPLEPIRNSHPELKEIQPGEELMSVNFEEKSDDEEPQDPLYKSLQDRIQTLRDENLEEDDDDDDDDGGSLVVRK